MRYLVIGAGAVGGLLAARLALAKREVVAVARGAHLAALQARGLTLRSPVGEERVEFATASTIEEAEPSSADVLLLTVKAQDVEALVPSIPPRATVVCFQNGVSTEPRVATRAGLVIGAMTWTPAVHIEPGVVEVFADAPAGVFRLGDHPDGAGASSAALAGDLRAAGFDADAVPDVMAWKRGKLLTNLGNVLDACAVRVPELRAIAEHAWAEAAAAFDAASLPYRTADEMITDLTSRVPGGQRVQGRASPGGSTWQSLSTGRPLEVDELNGWVVRLGASVGVPTPVNAGLVNLAAETKTPRSVSLARVQELTGLG